jgi:hypothetical protein
MPTPFSDMWRVHNMPTGELIAIEDIASAVCTPFANFFNGGLIRAEGGAREAVALWTNGGYFESNGLIIAIASPSAREIGIALGLIDAFNGVRDTTIINTGRIEARTAIDEQFNGGVVTRIVNTGVITGAITLDDGADNIENAAPITGNVQLGNGEDLYDGRTGIVEGVVSGVAGDVSGGSFDGGAGVDVADVDVRSVTDAVAFAQSDATAVLNVSGAASLALANI